MKRIVTVTLGRIAIAVLAFFAVGGHVWAQQEHGHESPHGGEVRAMGDYHVEFLVIHGEDSRGNIIIYLLDKALRPVPVDKFSGVIFLTLPDKSKQSYKLTATTEMLKSDHEEGEDHSIEEHHEQSEKEDDHGGSSQKDIPHFQVEVDLTDVDSFNAVVSLKLGNKFNNLRFKYIRAHHEHDEDQDHGGNES